MKLMRVCTKLTQSETNSESETAPENVQEVFKKWSNLRNWGKPNYFQNQKMLYTFQN